MVASEMKYCLCCGEDVPYSQIVREDRKELTCMYCGFLLDVKIKSDPGAANCIIAADDAPLIRELLKGMLVKRKLAKEIVSAENGQEMITAFAKRLAEEKQVDMVILDIQMPVMDGIAAARMMRSIEKKYQVPPAPILFFSSQRCDEALKKQLSLFSPARYVNKGNSADPAKMAERIDQLVNYLLHHRTSAPT